MHPLVGALGGASRWGGSRVGVPGRPVMLGARASRARGGGVLPRGGRGGEPPPPVAAAATATSAYAQARSQPFQTPLTTTASTPLAPITIASPTRPASATRNRRIASDVASVSSPAISASSPVTSATASRPSGSKREYGRGASAEVSRASIRANPMRGATYASTLGALGSARPLPGLRHRVHVDARVPAQAPRRGGGAPGASWRRPVASTIALFRSPVYALGCVVATTSWGFHVGALALAPISLVQSVIAGGLVLVTVLADRVFGHDVSRREWIGVALTAAGLAFLAATLEGAGDSAHAGYDGATLGLYVGLGDRRRAGARRAAPRRRARARRRGRAAVGRLGRDDQGAQRQDRGARARRGRPPVRARDPDAVAGRAAGVGPLAADRAGRACHRADERGRERAHDRQRADRVRRAAARGAPRRSRRGWRRSRS